MLIQLMIILKYVISRDILNRNLALKSTYDEIQRVVVLKIKRTFKVNRCRKVFLAFEQNSDLVIIV